MKKTKKSKKNNKAWFIKIRGSYLPNNLYGALTYIPFLGLIIAFTVWQINLKLSLATTLFHLFVFYVTTGVLMSYFASTKTK